MIPHQIFTEYDNACNYRDSSRDIAEYRAPCSLHLAQHIAHQMCRQQYASDTQVCARNEHLRDRQRREIISEALARDDVFDYERYMEHDESEHNYRKRYLYRSIVVPRVPHKYVAESHHYARDQQQHRSQRIYRDLRRTHHDHENQ